MLNLSKPRREYVVIQLPKLRYFTLNISLGLIRSTFTG